MSAPGPGPGPEPDVPRDEELAPEPEAPRLADALAAIPDEPLLPIERKLIAWSLVLGVGLLGVLAWLSHWLFPAPGPPG